MASRPISLWAEIVPGQAGLTTIEELQCLPRSGWSFELVEGRLIRVAPVGFDHGTLEADLSSAMRSYVRMRSLGSVATGETGFQLNRPGEPDTVLGADIAFVQADRLPARGSPERRGFLALAPDLVVEVASPGQTRPEMAAKAGVWLKAGVRLLWLIWPNRRCVDVWQPGSAEPVATLGEADDLDGLNVLPGFRYPIAQLFE